VIERRVRHEMNAFEKSPEALEGLIDFHGLDRVIFTQRGPLHRRSVLAS